jgi:uncharacterized protein (DUF1330 family)
MKRVYTVALAMLACVGLCAAAIQGAHAQGKPKAYTVIEVEPIDAAAQAIYTPLIVAAIKAAGARYFNTAGGKTLALVGETPKRVAIAEWDSVEQAQAFFNSQAYKNIIPQRDKAQKQVRWYIVESTGN